MKPKTKINTNPMDEAYKMVGGDPAIDAVSQAAKGNMPMTDKQKRVQEFNASPATQGCKDIDEAYAMLFESLAMIIRGNDNDESDAESPAEDKAEPGEEGGMCSCCKPGCQCGDCPGC